MFLVLCVRYVQSLGPHVARAPYVGWFSMMRKIFNVQIVLNSFFADLDENYNDPALLFFRLCELLWI